VGTGYGAPTPVRDIVPGPAGSAPHSVVPVNGRLYFAARDPNLGTELWRSDGTLANTFVTDLQVGSGSYPEALTAVNGGLFFVANDPGPPRLWTAQPARPPPAAPAFTGISPDTGAAPADRLTNSLSVTLFGTTAEPNLTVELVDADTNVVVSQL